MEQIRVWCSQFASCRWAGYRTVTDRGDVDSRVKACEKPCPRCGKQVVS